MVSACERWYIYVLRLASARFDWSFCLTRKSIPGDKAKPYGGGRYLYRLPDGCLKIKRVLNADATAKIRLPELTARGLTVGEDGSGGVTLDYQADLVAIAGELPERNPDFCDGVIALMASRIALNVTGDDRLTQALAAQAERSFRDAIAYDKQQDFSDARDPMALIRRAALRRRDDNAFI